MIIQRAATNLLHFLAFSGFLVGIQQQVLGFSWARQGAASDHQLENVLLADGTPFENTMQEEEAHPEQRMLNWNRLALRQVACPANYTTYQSLMSIQFMGEITNGRDTNKIRKMIKRVFKANSAVRCDPYQREVKSITFNRVINGTTPSDLPDMTTLSAVVLNLVVSAYRGGPTPATALEVNRVRSLPLDMSRYVDGRRRRNCRTRNILRDNPRCPGSGCYCPVELLNSDFAEIAGTTEIEFAESLQQRFELFKARKQQRRLEETVDESDKAGGEEETALEKIKNEDTRDVRNLVTEPPLEMVEYIDTVYEFQEFESCGTKKAIEANFTSFIDVDPCALGRDLLKVFLEKLKDEYNLYQFESCDSSHRRIDKFDLYLDCTKKNVTKKQGPRPKGGGGGSRRRLNSRQVSYRLGGTTTSEETITTENRRRMGEQSFSLLDNQEKKKPTSQNSNRAHRALISDMFVDPHKCYCAANPTETELLDNVRFQEMANEVLQDVTNGAYRLEGQLEVDGECPKDVFPDLTYAFIDLTVNKMLNEEELFDLEDRCHYKYNSWVIERCPDSYTQVLDCTLFQGNGVIYIDITAQTFDRSDPVFSCGNDCRQRNLNSEPSTSNERDPLQERRRRLVDEDYVEIDFIDECFCTAGGGSNGQNPTLEEFVNMIDKDNIVMSFKEHPFEEELPSSAPSDSPKSAPELPSSAPSDSPKSAPELPSSAPSDSPKSAPELPSSAPSDSPKSAPELPSSAPSDSPKSAPELPSSAPSDSPKSAPELPSSAPSDSPKSAPELPSSAPSDSPKSAPELPSSAPSDSPKSAPELPSSAPSDSPKSAPELPSSAPSDSPKSAPELPSSAPSDSPKSAPELPSSAPSDSPKSAPELPSSAPSDSPKSAPELPSSAPSDSPKSAPELPSSAPSDSPKSAPELPSSAPSDSPKSAPELPSSAPSDSPKSAPELPSSAPSDSPKSAPELPSSAPSDSPKSAPELPSSAPSDSPKSAPELPSSAPSDSPKSAPELPSSAPSDSPSNLLLDVGTLDSLNATTDTCKVVGAGIRCDIQTVVKGGGDKVDLRIQVDCPLDSQIAFDFRRASGCQCGAAVKHSDGKETFCPCIVCPLGFGNSPISIDCSMKEDPFIVASCSNLDCGFGCNGTCEFNCRNSGQSCPYCEDNPLQPQRALTSIRGHRR